MENNIDIKKSAKKGLKWTTSSAIISAIVKLLQVAILTRFLDKSDFGLVAIALLVNAFCAIFMDMGITTAVLHKLNITKNQYSSLYWFNILSGSILCLIAIALSPLISNYYQQEALKSIIPLLSLNIFFASVSGLQRTIQQKKLNFKFISIVEIFASIVMLATAIYFAYMGYGIYSLVYSTVINGLIIAVIYLFYGIFVEKIISFHFKIKEIISFLKIGIYQVGTSILDFFSSEMDILIISSSFSLDFLGGYTLCKQIVLRVYSLINPIITKILSPVLSLFQNNLNILKEKYIDVIKTLSFINFPIYFIIAYCSKSILYILYGSSYTEFSFVLFVLALNYGLMSMGNPVGALVIATGKTQTAFKWTIYRILSSLVILFLGSLFSKEIFIISILFLNIINLYPCWVILYRKLIPITFKELVKSFIKPILICLILVFVYFIGLLFNNYWLSLFIPSIIFGSLYLVFSLYLNKDSFNRFFSFLKK